MATYMQTNPSNVASNDILFQDQIFKTDSIQSRFLDILVRFFQENVKFKKVIELSGKITCKIDEGTTVEIQVPNILAQVIEAQDADVDDDDDDNGLVKIFKVEEDFYMEDNEASNVSQLKEEVFKEKKLNEKVFKDKKQVLTRKNIGTDHLKCDKCGEAFESRALLTRHVKNAHDLSLPYGCKHCEYRTRKLACLTLHSKIHEDKRVQCPKCSFVALNRIEFNSHCRAIHGGVIKQADERKGHPCDQCPFIGPKPFTLKMHKAVVHEKKKPFKCDQCDECFSYYGQRRTHIKKVHENVNLNRKYKCEKCQKEFSRLMHLKRHQLKEDCDEGNFDEYLSQVHVMHKCDQCNYKTEFQNKLKEHIDLVHKRILKFQCSKCGKLFGTNSKANRHELNCFCKQKRDNVSYPYTFVSSLIPSLLDKPKILKGQINSIKTIKRKKTKRKMTKMTK